MPEVVEREKGAPLRERLSAAHVYQQHELSRVRKVEYSYLNFNFKIATPTHRAACGESDEAILAAPRSRM